MKPQKCPISPIFPIMLGIIAISFSSIFIKWSDAPVSVQGMYRMLFTVGLMLPFVWKLRNQLKRISPKNWLRLILSGILLALHFLFWMGSLTYTSVASSTIIMALEPLFVMVGAFLVLKERTGKSALVCMGIAIVGAVFIGWGDVGLSDNQLWGDFLSLLGTVAVSAHMLLGQNLLKEVPSTLYSVLVFFCAAVSFACYNGITSIAMFDYPAKEWGIFILLAIVPTVFGHMIFNWLMKYVKATTVSMSILGEPVGATILAFFLLGEAISSHQMLGGVLTMLGLFFFLRRVREPAVKEGREVGEQTLVL